MIDGFSWIGWLIWHCSQAGHLVQRWEVRKKEEVEQLE
jgi:hypothetical protein